MRVDPQVLNSAPVFAALGDATRLLLVARLAAGGPLSIAQLSSGTQVTRQAITKHLQVLAVAGIAQSARLGRERHWELNRKQLDEARHAIDAISRQWDAALLRLKHSIEQENS